MERLKSITIIFLLAVGLLASAAPAKPAGVLLQEGLYAEEIEGDLDAAIKIYEQAIAEAEKVQRTAAHATYRIGMCYLKKGQKDKAAEYFQNIISDFPSQRAFARKAEKQLDKIKPRAERIVEQAVMTISTCAEGDPRVTRALESLKGLDENVVVNELVKFLNSETNTVRRSAIYILWKGNLSDISSAVPTLEQLCSHEENFTRGMTAIALGASKTDSSFDVLCDMTLKDPSGYARRCAAYALGLMGNAEAKPILEKALEDSDLLVRNNAKAALTMLEPPAVVGFGPVIERVVYQPNSGKECLIDFESGKLFTFPENLKDLPTDDARVLSWLKENGIDAVGAMNGALPGLEGFLELVVQPMYGLGWNATPRELVAEMGPRQQRHKAGVFAVGGLPFTYFFKTGQGGMGVLQILDLIKGDSPGVKIRYKMLQKQAQEPAITNARSVAEAFLAASVSGRDSEAIKLVKPGSAVVRQVKDFRQILEPEKLKIVSVHTDERIAVATTTEISVEDQKGPMLIRLIKQRGVWMVEDVDLETPASLKAELDSFLQKHPNATKLQEPKVRGLSVSPHRSLLDERTLIAINKQDQFGAKWFKVEHEYESASQSKKQRMIEKWMADAQKPDVTIRSSAIASLGNIACKQAADLLIKIAQEPLEFSRSNRPRWIAVRSLGRVGDMRAVPVLIDLLDHYNKDTQLYARVALCEITGVYFGADKAKWRKWWREKGKKLAELDLGLPQSTVINFTKAAIAGHVELALACFAPDSHDYEDAKELLTGAETNPLRMMLDAVDPDARIIIVSMEMAEEGTRCSIKWRMVLKRGFTIEGQTFKAGETFDLDGNLKKVGDRWLIVGI